MASKNKKGLGNTPNNSNNGIALTPERIGLYLFGLATLGVIGVFAYDHVKTLKEDAERYKLGLTQGNAGGVTPAGGVATNPNTGSGNGGGGGTDVTTDPDFEQKKRVLEAMIPQATPYGTVIKGVAYYGDAFPLRMYSGGNRVKLLQQALINTGQKTIIENAGGADGILGKGTAQALSNGGFSLPLTREDYLRVLSYDKYGKDIFLENLSGLGSLLQSEPLGLMDFIM